jgi:hypothetical protein
MATELEYDSLKDMKLADYKKAFKEKSQWKKAKAVLFLIDYKLDGKKVPIAIPLKRPSELKTLFKKAKGDKHPSKKLGGGTLRLEKSAAGTQFHIDLTIGGLSDEVLTLKGGKLFEQLLKAQLVVNSGNLPLDAASDDDEDEDRLDTDSEEGADMSDDGFETEVNSETEPTKPTEKIDFKGLLLAIKNGFTAVKERVVPKMKEKIYEAEMVDQIQQVIVDTNRFQEAFELVSDAAQEKLQAYTDHVVEIGRVLAKYMTILLQLEKTALKKGGEKTKAEKAKGHLLEIQSIVNELKSALADK